MKFGNYRVEIVPDCEFRLDGGAMFGVVPRNLWSKFCPPDEQNRIRMNMNCVFLDTGKERVLIETGIGDKWPQKYVAMYGIDRKRPLAESVEAITGTAPEDVTIVINTHLHFDHCGGNTVQGESGEPRAQFPNARYFISQTEYEHAEAPSDRDKASYFPENWRPLKASGQLELKPENYEVVPGLSMETHPGHNRSMQCWRLELNGKTLFGFADLVPMHAHVPFAWVMGYDLYPVETVEAKKKLLPEAARENWTCLFYHDPEHPLARIIEDQGKLRAISIGNV